MFYLPSFVIAGLLLNIGAGEVESRAKSAKITMVPMPLGNSVYFVLLNLGEELLSRGHNVQIAVSKLIKQRKSTVKHIRYNDSLEERSDDKMINHIISKGFTITDFRKPLAIIQKGCGDILQDQKVIEEFRSSDLIIGVSVFPCTGLIAEYVNRPFILVHPASFPGFAPSLMVPMPSSYVPSLQSGFTDEMNFKERMLNVVYSTIKEHILVKFVMSSFFSPFQLKHDIHTDKGVFEVAGMAEIHIVSADFALEFAHPLLPNTFYVGPMTPEPPKALPKELEQVMQDSGPHGAVLVSFGSQISQLRDDMLETMMNAFGKLNQTVIWRIKLPETFKPNKNVKALSWFPQNDILGHPKTKAFVGHMGANGAYEAAYHGVPVIAAPFMSDGYDNYLRLTKKGKMAKFIDVYKADVDMWVRTMEEVIYNPVYKNNATIVSKLMRSFPKSPNEKAADLVDYVLDNGGRVPHLKVYAYNLTWLQRHNLDVIAFLLVLVSIVLFVEYKLLRCCWGLCCKKSEAKPKPRSKKE